MVAPAASTGRAGNRSDGLPGRATVTSQPRTCASWNNSNTRWRLNPNSAASRGALGLAPVPSLDM